MISSMSRLTALLIGGVLLTGVASALAQPAAKPRTPAAEASAARGVIQSVGSGRLVLAAKQPGSNGGHVFVLDERTVFQRLGKTLTVKDLKVGDAVTVTYAMEDGTAVASRVWVQARAAATGGAKVR